MRWEPRQNFDFTSYPSQGSLITIRHTINVEDDSGSNRLPNVLSITISVRTSVSSCAQVPQFNNSNAQKLGSTPRRRFDDICWNSISFFFLVVNYSNPPSFQLCTREPAASQLIGNRKTPSLQPRINPPTSNSLFVYRQYVCLPCAVQKRGTRKDWVRFPDRDDVR